MPTGTGSYPYLGYFDLQQAPFTPVVDDAFFFADPAISQRLDMLRHLIQYSDLLLVVTGDQGSGKTSLLQQFLVSAQEQMQVCKVDAEYGMDAERLLECIAEGFGVLSAQPDVNALAESLNKIPGNRQALLLIDDAHRLTIEALAVLLELAELDGPDGKLLRIVLFCEPAINELLAAPTIAPLRDRITQTMEMPLFTEEQTEAYIRHRMKKAGLQTEFPFSAKLIKMIHKGARGNPARINELAHQALMEISGEEPQRSPLFPFSAREKWLPLAVAAGVVVALLTTLVVLTGGKDEQPKLVELEMEEHTLPIAPSDGSEGEETVVLLRNREESVPDYLEKEIELAVAEKASPDRNVESRPDSTPHLKGWPAGEQTEFEVSTAPEPVVEIPAAAQQSTAPVVAAQPVIDAVIPNPVPASWERQAVILQGSGFDAGSRVTVGWTGRVKELDADQIVVKSQQEMQIFITTGMAEDTWTVRVTNAAGGSSDIVTFRVEPSAVAQAEPAISAPDAVDTSDGAIYQEEWLMNQNPNHYTVQLMGSGREADIIGFVQRHHLKGKLAYFRGLSQGKDWYSLVSGIYPDFKSANAAAARLSKKLRGSSPWVRRIGNIRILLADLAEVPQRRAGFNPMPKGEQDVDWLRQQDPRHFTIQLLAGRDKATIKDFIRLHGPADGAVYFRTKRGGKDWYALVYNSYSNKADALAALKKLPSAWRKYHPWMRSFSSIQKELLQSE